MLKPRNQKAPAMKSGFNASVTPAGETAAYLIWLPAALILAMLFAFGFAFLIEKSKPKAVKS